MSATEWRERLAGRMPPDLAEEIDIFETQIELRKQGKIEERVFAETRLRRGAYGQRYDNGQRHDGVASRRARRTRPASSPRAPRRCGTRPGMQRIKIPFGGMTPEQLDVLAELAEEYSDGILPRHHAPGLPAPLRPHRGHARPHAPPGRGRHHHPRGLRQRGAQRHRLPARRRLPRPRPSTSRPTRDALIALPARPPRHARTSGASSRSPSRAARGDACGLVNMHDFGAASPRTRGRGRRRAARLRALRRRRPRRRAAPGQAARRVRPRGGAAADRAGHRARLRPPRREDEPQPRPHQVPGREARHRRVQAPGARGARQSCRTTRAGPRTSPTSQRYRRDAAASAGRAAERRRRGPRASTSWRATNVYRQRQPGYAVATVTLPLGDLTSDQTRAPGRHRPQVRRRHRAHDGRAEHRPALGERGRPAGALRRARRRSASATPGAGTIVDITACPGTDTCKLGIASSRGLAGELRTRLAATRVRARRGRARPAHQGQRLLQLLRPAPRRRPRLLRRQPQDRRLHRAALPGRAGRPVARQRRLLRPADRRGAVEAHPRGRRAPSPSRFVAERTARARASRTSSPASARRSCGR